MLAATRETDKNGDGSSVFVCSFCFDISFVLFCFLQRMGEWSQLSLRDRDSLVCRSPVFLSQSEMLGSGQGLGDRRRACPGGGIPPAQSEAGSAALEASSVLGRGRGWGEGRC